ncbi:MAG TPA: hypothetical protein VKB76_00475, partial [Ktedonobacterales bacterium]|nr:hypothetical protein [Ktedonobacterales bacterium]
MRRTLSSASLTSRLLRHELHQCLGRRARSALASRARAGAIAEHRSRCGGRGKCHGLRSALSAHGTPPNMTLIGLALFLMFFVMQPVLEQSWTVGLLPLTEGRFGEIEGRRIAIEPFHHFMTANVRSPDLRLFLDIAHWSPPPTPEDVPWR